MAIDRGSSFSGSLLGYGGETCGELCFNTGMTGYQEILTDPSYSGQIVTFTAPHIGNYGINHEDVESDRIQVKGMVIKEESLHPSNWRSQKSLHTYLSEQKIVGIKDVDTRAITRYIREKGAVKCVISSKDFNLSSLQQKIDREPDMEGLDLAKIVTTQKPYLYGEKEGSRKYKVAVLDFGIKTNILRQLSMAGCSITVLPAHTSAKDIMDLKPDGVFLSNGPGDPAAVTYGIETVKQTLGKIPIFGICLGHQILCLALGAKTFKLKFGHRGINHPVKNLLNSKIEITSQNHGFTVDRNSIISDMELTHVSLNDETVEGVSAKKHRAFSVQYHPESSPGPHDSRYLFNQFISMMEGS